VTYDEIVEEALCFGWIDSHSGTVDDERSKLWLKTAEGRERVVVPQQAAGWSDCSPPA
jgi:hypothetical protein